MNLTDLTSLALGMAAAALVFGAAAWLLGTTNTKR